MSACSFAIMDRESRVDRGARNLDMARKPITPREALLEAIAENRDDDTPRLVFADWLDENGNDVDRAWAVYIRLECAAARLSVDDPQRAELHKRTAPLYQRYSHLGWGDMLPAGF